MTNAVVPFDHLKLNIYAAPNARDGEPHTACGPIDRVLDRGRADDA